MLIYTVVTSLCLITSCSAAIPRYDPQPFSNILVRRQEETSDALVVDLGYEQYRGVANSSTHLNNWFG